LATKNASISAALATAMSKDRDITARGMGEMLNEDVMRKILDSKGMIGMPSTAMVDMITNRESPFRDQADRSVLLGMLKEMGRRIGGKWNKPGYEGSSEQTENTVNSAAVINLLIKNGFVDDAMEVLTNSIVSSMEGLNNSTEIESAKRSVKAKMSVDVGKVATAAARRSGVGSGGSVTAKIEQVRRSPTSTGVFRDLLAKLAARVKGPEGTASQMLDDATVDNLNKINFHISEMTKTDLDFKRKLEADLQLTGEQFNQIVNELRLNKISRDGII
jgi:hypothetical protein